MRLATRPSMSSTSADGSNVGRKAAALASPAAAASRSATSRVSVRLAGMRPKSRLTRSGAPYLPQIAARTAARARSIRETAVASSRNVTPGESRYVFARHARLQNFRGRPRVAIRYALPHCRQRGRGARCFAAGFGMRTAGSPRRAADRHGTPQNFGGCPSPAGLSLAPHCWQLRFEHP